MGRKTLGKREAKRRGALGGKAAWAGIGAKKRSQMMKALRAKALAK